MNTLKFVESDWHLLQNNKEIVDKWIAGLRSSKWVQTTGAMTNPAVANSACCLMVLEAECNNKTVNDYLYDVGNGVNCGFSLPSRQPSPLILECNALVKFLPEDLKAKDKNGYIYTPSEWNDVLHLSFNQIADLLEKGEIQFECYNSSLL